jgi:alkaline phosphatase D
MWAAGLAFALGASALSEMRASAAFSGGYPFKLGVASGDPLPDGVLRTRLAPDPLNGDGASNQDFAVRWEVSADEGFTRIVRSGTETATPGYGHSGHVKVEGLEPARYYWYRFEAGGDISPVGRTKTAPAADAVVSAMAFAFVSCQNWEAGYYPAYRALAGEDLDLVVHLGDYSYEGAGTTMGVRSHPGGDPMSLSEYRNRYTPSTRSTRTCRPPMPPTPSSSPGTTTRWTTTTPVSSPPTA